MLSVFFFKKFRTVFFFIFLALLLTPENMGIETKPYPALFFFIFELILEQNVSLRTLRPLVFTLPLVFILSILVNRFKKRFFQS